MSFKAVFISLEVSSYKNFNLKLLLDSTVNSRLGIFVLIFFLPFNFSVSVYCPIYITLLGSLIFYDSPQLEQNITGNLCLSVSQ